ncbi:MAG: SDR family oxidoreductase [Candidatus Heimdallarchaeota archaeon]|nr:SDR family oxidoreductase [Candidatus Heimdallarchaeota archaeon]
MSKKLALITGASSGIGKSFAEQLAEEGYNLILVARRKQKLEDLAEKLSKKFSTESQIVVADLSELEQIKNVVDIINSLDSIDILINNAGFGLSSGFAEGNAERQLDMVKVHVLASFSLCRAVIPVMLKRNEGLVINVSSISGLMIKYGDVTYTATKSFLIVLSEALQEELRKTDIRIHALCPGMTYSEFHDTEDLENFDRSSVPKGLWMSSSEVVRKSLKAARKGKTVYVPGFLNRVSLFFSNIALIRKISQWFIERKN